MLSGKPLIFIHSGNACAIRVGTVSTSGERFFHKTGLQQKKKSDPLQWASNRSNINEQETRLLYYLFYLQKCLPSNPSFL